VLGQRLGKIARKKQGSQLGAVVEQIRECRRSAQKPLREAYEKAKRTAFKKRSRALAKSVHWRHPQPDPVFAEAARATLVPLVDEFFAAAEADLSVIEALHQMRIAGKQVRYAMELLAGAFDASFRGELYATFVGVQEKLGTINDHATAIVMLVEWFDRSDYNGSRAELAELIANEERQLDVKCLAFRQWWNSERAADLSQQFASVLGSRTTVGAEETSARESDSGEARRATTPDPLEPTRLPLSEAKIIHRELRPRLP
jgi:CHAD domain-containing protein